MAIKTVSFAASDIGRVRSSNQDSGYAGVNLFFVADGMGGHAGGDIASAIASQHLALADEPLETNAEAEQKLIDYIYQAKQKIDASVKEHPAISGMGTTLSALMVTGTKVTIAHIGDSRIYLARDGVVKQITSDHTFVQRLVDTGRITEEEALTHPRRSVLMRVWAEKLPLISVGVYRQCFSLRQKLRAKLLRFAMESINQSIHPLWSMLVLPQFLKLETYLLLSRQSQHSCWIINSIFAWD